ncbi:PIN domain-containing protein [Neisseria meningitidis]|uniref:PIN domain-containing protein n=1 Tax=Neisseria meningitidis TaxID=487 RepID=UPI00031BD638|nr:PIN domain-containing protein [Neisseria meningitidis]
MKHLLIDFENVQPQNLDKLPTENTHIWLFIGVLHKMLPISLVQSLLRFGERVHLVQLQKTGKNALDFYLSYYLGQITATDPNAQIGILSRDGGYDVLVEHILKNHQAKGIVRLANIDEVQHQKITTEPPSALLENTPQPETTLKPQQPLTSYFQAALTALRRPDAFRPCRLHNLRQNLRKHILSDLFKEKTDEECEITTANVINKLKAQNFISIDEQETVSYHLSDNDLLQRIQRHILSQRPKTYADFQAVVQNRADALHLTVGTNDIQSFARHLRDQNLIRQNNGKIEYAPFTEPKPQPTPKQPKKTAWEPDEIIWKKVIAALSLKNRPNKTKTLRNTIQALTKSNAQETDKLLQHLQDTQVLRIDDTKIVYIK